MTGVKSILRRSTPACCDLPKANLVPYSLAQHLLHLDILGVLAFFSADIHGLSSCCQAVSEPGPRSTRLRLPAHTQALAVSAGDLRVLWGNAAYAGNRSLAH